MADEPRRNEGSPSPKRAKGEDEDQRAWAEMVRACTAPGTQRLDIGKAVSFITVLTSAQRVQVHEQLWTPQPDEELPAREVNGRPYTFQHRWLEQHPWLRYSRLHNGGYCVACLLFGEDLHRNRRFVDRIWDTGWQKPTEVLARHAARREHAAAWNALTRALEGDFSGLSARQIAPMIPHEREQRRQGQQQQPSLAHSLEPPPLIPLFAPVPVRLPEQPTGRHILDRLLMDVLPILLHCVHLYDTRTYVPAAVECLSDNTQSGEGSSGASSQHAALPLNPSIVARFHQLIEFLRVRGDPQLSRYYTPSLANLLPPSTLLRLVEAAGVCVRGRILSRVKASGCFAVRLEEVPTNTDEDALALALQYCEGTHIRVEFVSLVLGKNLTSNSLASAIWSALVDWGLDPENRLVGVGCNSFGRLVSVMQPACDALAARARSPLGFASRPHLSVISAVVAALPPLACTATLEMLDQLERLALFLRGHPKRVALFTQHAQRLRQESAHLVLSAFLCEAKQTRSAVGLVAFAGIFDVVLATLQDMASSANFLIFSLETITSAHALLAAVSSLEFIVSFNLLVDTCKHAHPQSAVLSALANQRPTKLPPDSGNESPGSPQQRKSTTLSSPTLAMHADVITILINRFYSLATPDLADDQRAKDKSRLLARWLGTETGDTDEGKSSVPLLQKLMSTLLQTMTEACTRFLRSRVDMGQHPVVSRVATMLLPPTMAKLSFECWFKWVTADVVLIKPEVLANFPDWQPQLTVWFQMWQNVPPAAAPHSIAQVLLSLQLPLPFLHWVMRTAGTMHLDGNDALVVSNLEDAKCILQPNALHMPEISDLVLVKLHHTCDPTPSAVVQTFHKISEPICISECCEPC